MYETRSRGAGGRLFTRIATLTLAALISGCAERRVGSRGAPAVPSATPPVAVAPASADAPRTSEAIPDGGYEQVEGLASYYGREFEGRQTASGTVFDKEEMVAAHPSYPFGTRLRVVNLDNGRSVVVRVTDRGPSSENVAEGVIIDVSQGAARVLGFLADGRQRVRLIVLSWGDGR